MTDINITTQWEDIRTDIYRLYNRLYSILERYDADINPNMTFEELCWAVESIPGKVYPKKVDKRPYKNLVYNPNGSIIHKDIYIYKKIRYFTEILSYALAYKGVSEYNIYAANSLSDYIELVNQIEGLHQSFLTITRYDNIFYYNTYTYILYDLVDENNKEITEGRLIVKQNNIIVAQGLASQILQILPNIISEEETYEIYYEGTDGYMESNHVQIVVSIKAPQVSIHIQTKNKSLLNRFDGITSDTVFFDTDDVEIKVRVTNPLASNNPMGNIPVAIQVPDKKNVYHTIARGISDEDGYFTYITNITVHDSELPNIYVYAQTQIIDKNIMSNADTKQRVFVKWSPICVENYKFYSQESPKTVTFYYRNIETGELTTEYVGSTVKIKDENNNYNYTVLPSVTSTSSSFDCEETIVNKYNYYYTLYKDNKIFYQAKNIIKINPLVKINLYIPDKLLKTSTNTLQCIVEVLDYQDNPTTLPDGIYLCTTYDWHCKKPYSSVYSINNSVTTIQLPINEILSHCNGFFIQAISVNDSNIHSNIVYVRNHLTNPLSSALTLTSDQQDYTLGDLTINTHGTIIDDENDPINRNVSISVIVDGTQKEQHTVTPNYKGIFNKDISIKEQWLSYDIEILCSFNGDPNYYGSSQESIIISYTKANINYWNVVNQTDTVYEECTSLHTIGLSKNSIYNKYINGTITFLEDVIQINNNEFTISFLPMTAGIHTLKLKYSGNRYYNSREENVPIDVNKTTHYNFDVSMDESIYYNQPMTFTPSLTGTTEALQTFSGTITYEFNDGYTTTQQIQPLTYYPPSAGEKSVTIIYSGDSNHEAKIITKTFTVQKLIPSISLSTPEIDAIYRSDIDSSNPISTLISYSNNDEHVPISIKVNNNQVYYDNTNKESDTVGILLDIVGNNIIDLITDVTNNYESITITNEIIGYDLVDELSKIITCMSNGTNYNDEYNITNNLNHILNCMITNEDTDEKMKERIYNVINGMEE